MIQIIDGETTTSKLKITAQPPVLHTCPLTGDAPQIGLYPASAPAVGISLFTPAQVQGRGMETTQADGPSTGKTTLLRDLIRIRVDKPIIVIDSIDEVAGDEQHPVFKKASQGRA